MVCAKTSLLAAAIALLPLAVQGHGREGLNYHISHEERQMNEPYLEELKKRFGPASARVLSPGHMHKRQSVVTSASHASSTASPAAGSNAGVATPSLSVGTIPIGVTTTLQPTTPLPTTYAAGTTAPIRSAPNLPSVVINPALWPALDLTPPTNTSQVQQWISAIDWSKVPNIPVNQLGSCANASNAQAVQDAATNGWWTCGGHTRSSDIIACPEKNDWGLSYDDGPSPDTPRLLNYMVQHNLTSTFFVVGSRAISRPEMLQYEYMAGHQISVHTWAHPYLTTRTNEQIVAELGWSKEAMRQIIGVSPNTFRPPYGDIDDRVRAIALQMGLQPIIWTSYNGSTFDTNDWQIAGGVVNADQVLQKFETIINGSSSMQTGFISLNHDLYQQSVSLAVNYVLPFALSKPKLEMKAIYQCLGQTLNNAYIETSSNVTQASGTASSGGVATTLDRSSTAKTTGIAAAAENAPSQTGAANKLAGSAITLLLAACAAIIV